MALHESDDLTCPRCGESLSGLAETVTAQGSDTLGEIRFRVECQNESCAAPLEIVVQSALPDAIGMDVWVEDRHDRVSE